MSERLLSDSSGQQPPGWDAAERRQHQRFVAKRGGNYCFWVELDKERFPLLDLSVQGFAIAPMTLPPIGAILAFTLYRDGVPDKITGRAEVRNHVDSGERRQAGCLFVEMDAEEVSRLRDWLTAHVLMTATVRITEKDAERIVSGPPLI